jgi:hypothetical protein
LVYKNDVEKYIEMKTRDIIDITMNKLKLVKLLSKIHFDAFVIVL